MTATKTTNAILSRTSKMRRRHANRCDAGVFVLELDLSRSLSVRAPAIVKWAIPSPWPAGPCTRSMEADAVRYAPGRC